MADFKHIWACSCRTETECSPQDQMLGSVFQCPGCHKVFGCVHSKGRGKVWIEANDTDIDFHDLLGLRREPEDDDEPSNAIEAHTRMCF